MLRGLLRLLGVDLSELPPEAEVSLQFPGAPESWRLFVFFFAVIAGAALVLWMYRRENAACSKPIRRLLAGLRIGVLILLATIWLQPALTYSNLRERQAAIVVLRDRSQSMNTNDPYFDSPAALAAASASGLTQDELQQQRPSRTELLNELAVREYQEFIFKLQEQADVIVVDFADDVQEREIRPRKKTVVRRPSTLSAVQADQASAADDAALLVADGRATDISQAIRAMLAKDPLAGIVLFSDGQQTSGDDPTDAARQAKERGVPIFVVGLGDPSRPRNVKLEHVYVRPQAWRNEPFEIEAVLSAMGVSSGDTMVQLIERPLIDGAGSPTAGAVAAQQRISFDGQTQRQTIKFTHTPKQQGKFVYTVKAEPLSAERSESDNQADSVVVDVQDENRIRVLLVAGSPSWDYRMVERLLLREKTIDLACWLQTLAPGRTQAGDTQLEELPRDKASLLEFDVIMLLDPNPDEFDEAWMELIKTEYAGRHSGGLLYMAGPQYANQFIRGSKTKAITQLLPVRLAEVRGADMLAMMSAHPQSSPLRIPPEYVDHPVMSLGGDPEASRARWHEMPGVYWSYPTERAKPTAQVLLEHSTALLSGAGEPRPLMVAGRYGSANTLFMGFPGAWRWRSVGQGAEYFDRFWIRVVRFLYDSRKRAGERRGRLEPEKDRYEIGERVRLIAELADEQSDQFNSAELEASVEVDGVVVRRLVMRPVTDQPGRYQATMPAGRAGVHTATLELPPPAIEAEDQPTKPIEATFTVVLPTLETNQVWQNRPLLKEIAEVSGGRYYDLHQLDQLAMAMPDTTETITAPGKPLFLWDNWLAMLLLGALLSVEWGVRKATKLM